MLNTATVVTTCSASTDCTDFAIPACSGDVCVAMSCGGGSFTPHGRSFPAYPGGKSWDEVPGKTGSGKMFHRNVISGADFISRREARAA